MSMQRGFGAAPSVAPEQGSGDPLLQGSGIFRLKNKEGQNRRTVILLDDEPIWGYRHKIQRPYVEGKQPEGDWREMDIRVTCAAAAEKDDQPRQCLICEARIRNSEVIKRNFTANMTIIDEGEHKTKKGNIYYDLKKLLELDWSYYQMFEQQKKAQPHGRLVGMRFSVMRSTGDPKQSKTFGNIWTPLGVVPLAQHFASSHAVRHILEMASKRGERISHEEAVRRLISPIDYSKELENYSPQLAERFVMRAVSRNFTASATQSGGYGAPIGGAQTMAPHTAPDYSVQQVPPGFGGQPQQQPQQQPMMGQQQQMQGMMPMGQMPQQQQQQQQPMMQQPQQGMMPMGQVPPQMQQPFVGYGQQGGSVPPPPPNGQPGPAQGFQGAPPGFGGPPMGPAPVGDPQGATMPTGMGMSQPTLAPWGNQQMQPQQQPQQQQQPMMGQQPQQMQGMMPMGQPQMPQQPQGQPQQAPQNVGGYSFEAGWQSSFPGQQQPQPVPQGQPVYGQQMQGPPQQQQQQPMMQQPQQQMQGQQQMQPQQGQQVPRVKLPF